MVTKEQAIQLGERRHGELWHLTEKNADGTPVRCRVNGKCRTWKRRPTAYELPVKYGLRHCFYLTEYTAIHWRLSPATALNLLQCRLALLRQEAGLTWEAPNWALADKLDDLDRPADAAWVREQPQC